MIGQHFYNESIKTAVAVFGSLFNNIVIKRRDGKFLPVPISYGPRVKWLEAQKQFKREEEMFEKLLPRISYEIVAMNYDTDRKISNKQTVIRTPDTLNIPRQRVHSPTPYNLDFTMYITTKNLNDGWQIVEQILPFFTPAYTVKVRNFPMDADSDTPVPTNTYDMPFILTAATWADDWTGDIGDRRIVEWNLEFTSKIWLYGPATTTNIIYDSRAIIGIPARDSDGNVPELYQLSRGLKPIEGSEVGWVQVTQTDSDAVLNNDSNLSPSVINLSDSDGNIVKIVRDLSTI
jgi:hypothetical protein